MSKDIKMNEKKGDAGGDDDWKKKQKRKGLIDKKIFADCDREIDTLIGRYCDI